MNCGVDVFLLSALYKTDFQHKINVKELLNFNVIYVAL